MSRLTSCLVFAAVLLGTSGASAQTGDELWRQAQGYYEEFTWDRAIELFEKFVAENPQDDRVPEAQYKILYSLFRLEKYEDFEASLQRYIDDYPHSLWSARAQILLAKHLYESQRWNNWDRIGNLYAEALRDYRAAIGRRPMTPEEKRVYVDMLFDASAFYADWYNDRARELAEQHLQTIIQYNLDADTTGRAWLQLGQLYLHRLDNVAKAQQAWLTVVHEYAKSESADDALYWLAQYDERTGNYVRARARYLMLRRQYPDSPYEDDAQERIQAIEAPRLNLRVSETHLPGASIPTRINARNIDGVQFVAYQVPTDDIVKDLGRRDVSTPEALLKGATKVFTWHRDIADEGQYKFHQLKTDSPMRAAGLYVVEARADGHPDLIDRAVVNISSLVLVQNYAADKLVNYVASRTTRQPVPGVDLRVFRPRDKGVRELGTGSTDGDGLWRVTVPPRREDDDWRLMTVGRKGDELVIQDNGIYAYWNQPTAQLQAYVYTDRPVYRPGNTVHYRAILRTDLEGDFENLPNKQVEVTINDARGEELQKTTLTTDAYGTIGGELTLGDEPTLGVYNILLKVDDQGASGNFRVEEYRKPEFEVKVGQPLSEVRPGSAAAVPITATYYFGAPVADAEVHYVVQRRPYWHSYWWRGPWDWFYSGWREERHGWYGQQMVTEGTVTTDADGQAIIEFKTTDDSQDYVYTINAEVADVTRRVVEAAGSVTVTQKGFYLFATTNQSLYAPGDDVTATAKAETADSQPVETPVDITLWKLKWVPEKKDPKTGEVTVGGHYERDTKVWDRERRVDTDPASGEEDLLFKAPADGFYELEMVAPDTIDPKASVTATTRFWVASDAWKGVNYNHANLQVITEKDLYERGDSARVLINSPVPTGAILLTIGAEHIYDTKVIRFEQNSTVIDLPIPDNYSPNVFLKATVVAARQVYFAEKELMVPPTDELLNVKVESDQAEYKPRTQGTFVITTTDQNGNPVPAQVSLGITDESVYAIQEEMVQTIGAFFYGGRRYDGIRTQVSFEAYGEYDEAFEERAEMSADAAPAEGAAPPRPSAAPEPGALRKAAAPQGMGGGAGGEEPVVIREFFPDTILWQPTVTTDANGKATVTVDFPDSLTTWRATARAITQDTHVGQQVERVITTKDLIVRLQAPRFFTQLDRSTISVIVTNKTSNQQQVAVGLQVDGLQLVGEATGSVVVAPNGQARLDREVVAAEPGRATITVTARGPNDSDGLKLNFDVIPHGAEKFENQVGLLGESGAATFDMNLPAARREEATSLQVSVQPTLAATLLDALPYLIDYPYGCVEQTTSRFIPAVMVARTLDYTGKTDPNGKPQLAPEWWQQRDLDELPEMVKSGIKRLAGMQNPDGGFGWFGGMRSSVWMTSYVVYGLTQARLADFTVPDEMLNPAVTFLYRNLHLTKDQLDNAAYVAYVLSETMAAGVIKPDADGTKALEDAFQRVYANRDKLNDYTRALLILGLVNKGERDKAEVVWRNLQAHRIETEHGVHWGENRWGWRWSEDQVETTAYCVQAALAMEPASELAQKAVQWLVLNRTANHWYSTKDTAAAVYAMVKYADAHDELNPNYTLVLKVNGTDVKGWEVNRDNALTLDGTVMVDPNLLKTGDNRIELVRDGTGRAYYSAFLEYYTTEEPITGASSYLSATRKYYRISEYTDPEDNRRKTRRERIEDGAVVASGQEIEVEITVDAENDFDHVCFADPKPAGCEPVDQTSGGTWGGAWLYRELRDEEVTFFADHIQQGKTTFTYRLRAETPGTFHALPHNGFSMYRPDVRCLSDEDLIRVGEREAPAEE